VLPQRAQLPFVIPTPCRFEARPDVGVIKANLAPFVQPGFPENARTSTPADLPAISGNFYLAGRFAPQFP
jgi:hypothetical protein